MAQNNLIERVKFSFSRVSSLCHVGFILFCPEDMFKIYKLLLKNTLKNMVLFSMQN